jgi:hypothetical protein
MAGSAATALAIGSMAWYYHLYGTELHAMTPTEEGSVRHKGLQLRWTDALKADEAAGIENFALQIACNHSKRTYG